MKETIVNVFKGLTPQYYFRQLFFGALIAGLMILMISQGGEPLSEYFGFFVFCGINTLLYPYARFAYETIVEFIVGNNIFFTDSLIFIMAKFLTISLCWGFAIFIAPVGLLFIYFYQKKPQERDRD